MNGNNIYITGAGGSKYGTTFIKEEPFESATNGHYTQCVVVTAAFDNYLCKVKCETPDSTDEIISRARASVKFYGQVPTTYNLYKCNCQHWVTYWRYGLGYSMQTGMAFRGPLADSSCPAQGVGAACQKGFFRRHFHFLYGACA